MKLTIQNREYILLKEHVEINNVIIDNKYFKEVSNKFYDEKWRCENNVDILCLDNYEIILQEYHVTIPMNHLNMIAKLIEDLEVIDDKEYISVNFNKYFDYVIIKDNIYLLDKKFYGHGEWEIKQLVGTIPLKYGTMINWKNDCIFEYSNRFLRLKNGLLCIDFWRSEYERFIKEINRKE